MVNPTLLEDRAPLPLPSQYATLQGQRILVTGAAGFIGGAILKRLYQYGLDVVGTVLYPKEAEVLNKNGYSAEVLDLASEVSWAQLLTDIDIVFNIAALFQEVENTEAMYNKVNVDGTLKLLRTAHFAGVKRFVHCSTVGVHGHVKEIPCTENSPYNPMDEYHRSKLKGEQAVLTYAKSLSDQDMIVTVNRPAMVYGPGDIRMLKFFKAVSSGKFIMIGSGETLAHLGYIDDQVDSLILGAVGSRNNVHLQAFNIASDTHLTLNKMATIIADACGKRVSKLKIPIAPVWAAGLTCELICRPFGIKPPIFRRRVGFFTHNRSFDVSKANSLLNYQSKTSNEEGIRRTINWYRTHNLI